MKIKFKVLLGIICLLLIVGIVGGGIHVWSYFSSQEAAAEQVNTLKDIAQGKTASSLTSETSDIESEAEDAEKMIDISALQELNDDCVAWIEIPGTDIDYPVMQTDKENKDFYLSRDFEKNPSRYGLPYLDHRNAILAWNNLIIYGHHMDDGTMFSALHNYKEKEFLEEHDRIILYTSDSKQEYEPFAVLLPDGAIRESDFSIYNITYVESKNIFDEILDEIESNALIWLDDKRPTYADQTITLSTCEYSKDNGRLVVMAKEIR